MYMVLLSPRTSLIHFTSIVFKTKSLDTKHVSSHHVTTFHIISLIYTKSSLEFPFL